MSRAFLLVLLLVLFAHAQLRLGVVTGLDYNQYSIDTQYQFDMRYDGVKGITAGLSAQYNFMDWLGARADFVWAERGYRLYRSAYILQNFLSMKSTASIATATSDGILVTLPMRISYEKL